MKTAKSINLWALINVNTGKFSQRGVINSDYINNIKDGSLLVFKTKKECGEYIIENRSWALKPIKVIRESNRYLNQDTNYSIM